MSQSRMFVAGQSQFRKHRSPRILPNQVRETPLRSGAASAERRSPRRKARPTTVSNIEVVRLLSMGSSLSEFEECQHFGDFSDRRDCLEHRRPLAREGSPSCVVDSTTEGSPASNRAGGWFEELHFKQRRRSALWTHRSEASSTPRIPGMGVQDQAVCREACGTSTARDATANRTLSPSERAAAEERHSR